MVVVQRRGIWGGHLSLLGHRRHHGGLGSQGEGPLGEQIFLEAFEALGDELDITRQLDAVRHLLLAGECRSGRAVGQLLRGLHHLLLHLDRVQALLDELLLEIKALKHKIVDLRWEVWLWRRKAFLTQTWLGRSQWLRIGCLGGRGGVFQV